MAFATHNNDPSDDPVVENNIIPFVDVVLALLIVFMIAAGAVEFDLAIDAPRTREAAAAPQEPAYVNITSRGKVFFGGEPVDIADVAQRAKERNAGAPGIYLRAHKTAPWEIVARVMAECGANGVNVLSGRAREATTRRNDFGLEFFNLGERDCGEGDGIRNAQ